MSLVEAPGQDRQRMLCWVSARLSTEELPNSETAIPVWTTGATWTLARLMDGMVLLPCRKGGPPQWLTC